MKRRAWSSVIVVSFGADGRSDWQSRQQKIADVSVSNLHYADASLSVVAGILPLTESGAFQLSRAVSGAEAIDAITRIEQLYNSTK